jgi:hypothetical protein
MRFMTMLMQTRMNMLMKMLGTLLLSHFGNDDFNDGNTFICF